MRKLKNIYWAGIALFALLPAQKTGAQNTGVFLSNPASIELLKAKSLWFNTNNGAGLTLDKMYNYNDLLFNYNIKNGDFKREFEGTDERAFGVSTEGALNLGSAFVWGKFDYNNEKQTGTLYNTTMLDPTRGVPYYTVDKNLSDWVKQDYNLQMKASSKLLWDRFLLGVDAQYNTKTGAKQIDPRSDIDFFTISVKPGVVAIFNRHMVGLNLDYEKLNQESRTTNSNSQQNQDVYVMKGLGNFYSATVGGLQSLGKFVYKGNKIGGSVQYSLAGESLKLLLDGKYTFKVEDVTSSQTKPKKEGTIKENHYETNLQLIKTGENISKVELSYTENKISGIEYVQVLDNTFEVQRWVTTYQSIRSTYSLKDLAFRYDFFRGNDYEYKWRAGIIANYKKSDDLYIMPESILKIEELIIGINGKVNLKVNKSNRLLAGVSLNYKHNLDGKYTYGGADATSPVITQFTTPDFLYLKQSYYKAGGEISYFADIHKKGKSGIFVKAAVDYYKPTEGSNERLFSNLSVGFTF